MKNISSYIIETIDIGIRVINIEGLIIYCNSKMAKIIGLNENEICGKHILELHEDLEEKSSTLLNCVKTGNSINNKIKIRFNNKGEMIYLVSTNIPIFKDGKIIGAIEYVKTEDSFGDLFSYLLRDAKKEMKIKSRLDLKSSYSYNFSDFLTVEKEMTFLIEKISHMALYDYNVLIFGETGTGKEIIAQSIHNKSPRKNKPFIAQNCAAIPENLLESIFFGTEVGSFTGAVQKIGLFEQADGGTLLLDELNSLPIFLQAKLLRVLEEGCIRRVGGKRDIYVNVRIIGTTNENPETLMRDKKLREDLFYRLGPIYINIPPLRDRKSDIDYLTRIFIKRESKRIKIKEPNISVKVKDFFRKYPWPGNVRELKNVVNYLLLNSLFVDPINLEHLPHYMKKNMMNIKVKDYDDLDYNKRMLEFEKSIISEALEITKGNISEASKILGIKRQTLQYRIKKMGL